MRDSFSSAVSCRIAVAPCASASARLRAAHWRRRRPARLSSGTRVGRSLPARWPWCSPVGAPGTHRSTRCAAGVLRHLTAMADGRAGVSTSAGLGGWVGAAESDERHRIGHFMAVTPTRAKVHHSAAEARPAEHAPTAHHAGICGHLPALDRVHLDSGSIPGSPFVQGELPDVACHVVQPSALDGYLPTALVAPMPAAE